MTVIPIPVKKLVMPSLPKKTPIKAKIETIDELII